MNEAKDVLDKANFCPMPATWAFSFAFATASLYDLVFKARKQTHRLDQLLLFKNRLHLSTFIGAELYIAST